MKIVKIANESRRELGLNEKGDITELITPEYTIRFDDKKEYEKAESIIIETVKLGFDVYISQPNTVKNKLTYDSECGKVYDNTGVLISIIENEKSHGLKGIIRKIMETTK